MASESHWTMSYSVMEPGRPEAGCRTRPISRKAWARMASILRWAYVVAGHLVGGEHGFKLADQVGGTDDLLAEGAKEFDGSRVDHGDVHDGVARGILHGQAVRAGEHGVERGGQLLPAGVDGLWCREGVEAAGFDAMDELARLTDSRDEVIPAAGDVGVRIEAKDACSDGIAVVMIVKEPAVEGGGAKSGLNGFQLHGNSIRHLRKAVKPPAFGMA